MLGFSDFRAFMARYFPIFMLGYFLCVLAIAVSTVLWVSTFWRRNPDSPFYMMACAAVLSLLLTFGHYLMVRGVSWSLWATLPVPGVALLMGLSLIGAGSNMLVLGFVLGLPLLALLTFNSTRHREMRQRLVALRQARQQG
ncbi:hypothetical protein F3J45_12625 [Pantoea sp. Ap-967]|uniref:hypothetical protein n=1 Tax=Pantoea sp. Ap-967 TaxID=2608362 RepID=UPI001423F744|nr:hypothetical protein [Pantoea sp. Ap-967]NIE75283.1 hypothetical protein [Pantoea sp. Ap-967]